MTLLDAPVLEHAVLTVRPGAGPDLEAAFAAALPPIDSIQGFRGLRVSRGLDSPGTYVLLVEHFAPPLTDPDPA